MRTAKEMRDFSSQYSVTNKLLIGVKLKNCPFEDIVSALKPDEEVLFCFGAIYEKAIALTNYRIIIAETRSLINGQNGGITFFNYENIKDVVAIIDDIVNKYKNSGKAADVQAVQQVSVADELKKFKELLDMDIISREEFEAKKKQLLGL